MSNPASPPPSTPPVEGPSRANAITAWVLCITAVVGLIVALIGLFKTSDARQQADNTVTSQGQTIASLSSELATATIPTTVTVTATLSPTMQDSSTRPTVTAPATHTSGQVTPTPHNQGSIKLVPGSPPLDLDSTDETWAAAIPIRDADLAFNSPPDRLTPSEGAKMALLGPSTLADYNSCRANYTSLSGGEVMLPMFKVGDNVCILTGEKRYVAMVVTSLDGGITFSVVSYDPPGV